ncbi:MAG: hypothetical protein P4K94_09310 [Terracidiphilus sp.]|nr:hypothetical protein [Terracidiphilus sp.]
MKSQRKPRVQPQKPRASNLDLLIYLALFLATFAVYAQVRHFDFVNLDDPEYTTENVHVQQGLTAGGADMGAHRKRRFQLAPTDLGLPHAGLPVLWRGQRLAPPAQRSAARAGSHPVVHIPAAGNGHALAQRVSGVIICIASAACGVRGLDS